MPLSSPHVTSSHVPSLVHLTSSPAPYPTERHTTSKQATGSPHHHHYALIHHRPSPINATVSPSPTYPLMAAEQSPPSPSLQQIDDPSSNSEQSQIPSINPSKIPIRPQKMRKLSSMESTTTLPEEINPQTTIADADASKSIILSTATSTTGTTKTRRRNPAQLAKDLPKIIKPLSSPGEIAAALHHLRSTDPLIANLIANHPPPTFDTHQAPFLALSKSILYQQLAYKAGTSIYTRFVTLCGGENSVVPETVLSLTSQQLKQIGVSGRKASYLFDLANKYKNGILSDDSIVKMDDRSLFTMLSMVKGIGSWSVHMFMIFALHRPDVLPVSDLGVRKGVQLLYSLDELPRPSQMEQLCVKWRPYRSVGAWYMWRFVEGKGAQAGGTAIENDSFSGQQQIVQSEQAQQQQHQSQLLEPITNIGNLGACIWGQ